MDIDGKLVGLNDPNAIFPHIIFTATRMFPGTTSGNGRSKMQGVTVQQPVPRSKHKFPAPAPPQIPKGGGGRSPAGSSSTTTTTATPSPVSRFSRAPHWPADAVPKRVKKLSWDDRNSCAHMTVCMLYLHDIIVVAIDATRYKILAMREGL